MEAGWARGLLFRNMDGMANMGRSVGVLGWRMRLWTASDEPLHNVDWHLPVRSHSVLLSLGADKIQSPPSPDSHVFTTPPYTYPPRRLL